MSQLRGFKRKQKRFIWPITAHLATSTTNQSSKLLYKGGAIGQETGAKINLFYPAAHCNNQETV